MKIYSAFVSFLLSLVVSASPASQLNQIFDTIRKVDDPVVQANLLRGTLTGLSGARELEAPASWSSLRLKLSRSKNEEVVKLTSQLSQIFGDRSISEDALKLLLNKSASISDRREALSGLVTMRFNELPPKLKFLLDTELQIDAIRAYSFFDYPEAPSVLLSAYSKFDAKVKRITVDTLSSRLSYAKELLGALKEGKIEKAQIPTYTARKLKKILGSSFDKVYGEIVEMGELSQIDKNPVKARPDGFLDARRIEVGVLPGLKFNTARIEAKAGEKIIFVFPNDDSSGMMHNLAIITPGSRETVLDAAVAMGAAGLKKNFVPEIPELLASTPQVAQGMKYTLYFSVPEEPGDYHFICTYPGHGLIMQGIFAVQ
jgi:azurin